MLAMLRVARCCSYDIPVVKDSVLYADALLKSYSLSAAAYRNAEALATTVYRRAGEPLQDKLQPQVSVCQVDEQA